MTPQRWFNGFLVVIGICLMAYYYSPNKVPIRFSSLRVTETQESCKYSTDKLDMPLSEKKKENRRVAPNQQRIVFMAGPHKTGSTSIQVNLATWSQENILGQWKWGINSTTCIFQDISHLANGRIPANRKIELKFAKGYAPLFNLLAKTSHSYPENEEDQAKMIQCYRDQMIAFWADGYNIVLGSEAGDFILRSSIDSKDFIQGIMNIMPWPTLHGSSENVTFVITYRWPRVDHYVSYWHMAGDPPALREWTIKTNYELNPLNPLGLARKFTEFGFQVIIIDTSGLNSEGVDLSNSVACEILKVPCENSQVIGNTLPPEVRNHRDDNGMKDLSANELATIDAAMLDFDCNYRDLLFHPNVTIKYGTSLTQTLANCPSDREFVPLSSLIKQIKDIARNGDGK